MSVTTPDPGAWQAPDGSWRPAPPAVVYAGQPRTSGWAAAAVMASVLSFVVMPVVPAVAALFWARRAARDLSASEGALTGAGLVKLARAIAGLHLVLVAAVLVGAAVTFLLR